MNPLKFPKSFLWGAATSSHQVEGNMNNDWSEWEISEERKRYHEMKGNNPTQFISGLACDSFSKQADDLDCLRQLGVNAYRFSIEWSRVEPRRGEFDEAVLERYRMFIKNLRAQGIEPFVTLWHWPVPLWVRDQGGWKSAKTADLFDSFVAKVVETLGSEVKFWVTLNEPQVYTSNSFFVGVWPPQEKNLWTCVRVMKHLVRAHKLAYATIKNANADHQVGIASHNIHFSAKQPWIVNQLIAKVCVYFWNDWFLKQIRHHQDYIGLNYYFHRSFDLRFGKSGKHRLTSDLGWELHPDGIRSVLLGLKQFKKPVYILEHGLADKNDQHRMWYIRESLAAVRKAMDAGVDVRGYFHWSLLDNFEWAEGFTARFGLFEVDFRTCERKPRASVAAYREIIKSSRESAQS